MKQYILVAAAIMMLVSCAKNEITETPPKDGSLVFSLSTSGVQNTRAAELSNNSLAGKANIRGEGIALYAYQNANSTWSKWFSDELIYNSGWGINSIRFANVNQTRYVSYWPLATQSSMLTEVETTFADTHFTADSYPQFVYNINHNEGSPDDLVAALTNVDAGKQSVNIQLRHLLSQVNFGVKGGSGKEITISSITISGIGSKATYTFDGNPAATPATVGSWSTPTDPFVGSDGKGYTYQIAGATSGGNTIPANAVSAIYMLGDGGNAAVGTGAYYWNGIAWDSGFTPANGAKPTGLSNALMLLPQTFTENGISQAVISYSIDGVPQGNYPIDLGSFNIDWQQGMRYVYLLNYTPVGDPFSVTVSMTPWKDVDPVNLPNHQMMPSNGEMNQGGKLEITGILAGNAVWDMSDYEFLSIANTVVGPSHTQTLDLTNMKFGTGSDLYNITLTLPTGLVASGTGVTVTASGYKIASPADVVTITNKSFYNDQGALMWAVTQSSGTNTAFGLGGNGSGIDLADYDMSAIAPGATLSVTFQYDIPQGRYIDKLQPDTDGSGWSWNSATYTATYTALTDNQEVKIPSVYQFNGINVGETWYVASAGKNASARKAYLPNSPTWIFTTNYGYYYNGLPDIGNAFYLDFSNVSFSGNNIQLNVPLGYSAKDVDAVSGATTITVSSPVKVMIYNRSTYNSPNPLQSVVEAGKYQSNSDYAANGFQFGYLGNGISLDPTSFDMSAVTSGNVSIAFLSTAPQQIITLRMQPRDQTSYWAWNAATKTARYTVPPNNQEVQQPTIGQLNNAMSNGVYTWYVASGGTTYNKNRTAVVTSDKTWNYTYLKLERNKSITLDFTNVTFGSYKISITPPPYYDISPSNTTTGSQIAITNKSVYTSKEDLYAAIAKDDGTGVFYFAGNGSVITFNTGAPNWNPITSKAGTQVIFIDTPPSTSGSWTWTLIGNTATCNTSQP